MPYRRLPKTDKTRLKALKELLDKTRNMDFRNQVVTLNTVSKARNALTLFEKKLLEYEMTQKEERSSNKRHRHLAANAQMYVSHFIQVLNLAVIRGDVKRPQKELYGLDPDTNTVPDLNTDGALLEWGQKIITGENERLRNGGFAIYNPTIAKVQVHYNIFKDYQFIYHQQKDASKRCREELEKVRTQIDELLLDIWNQVEAHFADCKPYDRLIKCQSYGLIYYYRRREPELTPADDIE